MRIPKSIILSKKPYSVEFFNPDSFLDGKNLFGMTDFSSRTIRINKKQSRQGREETLLHELIHVALYISDMSSEKDCVERYVESCYTHLYMLLRKNKLIKKFNHKITSIDTGTFKYKIRYVKTLFDDSSLSVIDYDKRVISINPVINKDVFGEELIKNLLNISFSESGMQSDTGLEEEDFVSFVSPCLYRIFSLNGFFMS